MQNLIISILTAMFLVACGETGSNIDSTDNSNSEDSTALVVDSSVNDGKNIDSKYSELIGKDYFSLTEFEALNGFEDMGGSLIGELNSGYSVSIYRKDSVALLAFEKTIEHINGKAKHNLLDIVEIIGLDENQEICHGAMGCRIDGKYDPELVAVFLFEDKDVEFHTGITEAWRANRLTEKFEQIETKGIDCYNELYGAE